MLLDNVTTLENTTNILIRIFKYTNNDKIHLQINKLLDMC